MKTLAGTSALSGAALFAAGLALAQAPAPTPKYPNYPSEMPAAFKPAVDTFDYVRRDVMIPMRDGVKLHTVILVPQGREGRADPPDAHALRRRRAHEPRGELAPRPGRSRATTTRPT